MALILVSGMNEGINQTIQHMIEKADADWKTCRCDWDVVISRLDEIRPDIAVMSEWAAMARIDRGSKTAPRAITEAKRRRPNLKILVFAALQGSVEQALSEGADHALLVQNMTRELIPAVRCLLPTTDDRHVAR